MTTIMSSPLTSPSSSPTPTNTNLSTHLDSQIARLNAQIATLRQQQQSLSSALLASSTLQNVVELRKTSQYPVAGSEEDPIFRRLEEAVTRQQARNDIKVHRLMNNVTSFPFTDPAPDRQQDGEGAMLGLRFEMPFTHASSSGLLEPQRDQIDSDADTQRVYLVMLRRVKHGRKTYLELQPEMNQIPKHIDVEGYATRYLHVPDIDDENSRRSPSVPASETFQDDSGIDVTQDLTQMINGTNAHTTTSTANASSNSNRPAPIDITDTNQSLPLFVSTTCDALLSWHYRSSYIQHITTSLSLASSSSNKSTPSYKHAITHLQSNPPATQLTIDWTNGTTALLGITEKGYVGIARVFGPRMGRDDEEVEGDGGTCRCHSVERKVEGIRLGDLASKLEEIGQLMRG